ncbi:aminotransferase class IV [Dongia soli]|uniref:Probable branched-chain-amino-acid aminotransferase n=1 Tax=Dongia soli TaxID=600628 RepID=A0ABU5E508_9PROT|nr:aminotransferase class IV [Dongia soli]MDY0881341.1 aminotransferase class IV [Dongia soli]
MTAPVGEAMERQDLVWLDGILLDRPAARIDPADRGLLLGDGLFETVLVRMGQAEHLELHLQRLARSADLLGIPLPLDAPGIAVAVDDLLAALGLRQDLAALRITLTRGIGRRGLLPPDEPQSHLLMTAVPYHPPAQTALAASIVDIRRNEGSPLSRLKSLNYLDNVLALQQAVARGVDEGLMCNNAGAICCASRANFFIIRGRRLQTPPLSDGVLDGIQRHLVLQHAAAAGYEVFEKTLLPSDLPGIDEAFVTNSLMGLMPLSQIDDLALPESTRAQELRVLLENIVID